MPLVPSHAHEHGAERWIGIRTVDAFKVFVLHMEIVRPQSQRVIELKVVYAGFAGNRPQPEARAMRTLVVHDC